MRTESRVVMLTDMKGFTAATSRQAGGERPHAPPARRAALAGDRGLRRPAGQEHPRRLPGALAAPTEALPWRCIQDRLADHADRVVESERIEVRIALALGDVRLDGGDVFGDAVNLFARIEAESESGEVWFSESVYWTLDRSRIPVEDMAGWRPIPGLREEVRLFRVARAVTGAPGDAPYAVSAWSWWWGWPPRRRSCRAPARAGGRRRWWAGGCALSVALALLLAGGAAGG